MRLPLLLLSSSFGFLETYDKVLTNGQGLGGGAIQAGVLQMRVSAVGNCGLSTRGRSACVCACVLAAGTSALRACKRSARVQLL